MGGRLNLNLVGKRAFGGDSIVRSVVTFGGRDNPATLKEFSGNQTLPYGAVPFVMSRVQTSLVARLDGSSGKVFLVL